MIPSFQVESQRIYAKVWGVFSRWCWAKGTSQQEISAILDFLQDGTEQGLAAKTLRVQVAALSSFLDKRLSLDPLIKRFLSARERMSPVLMGKFPPSDLTLVLEALTRAPFEPLVHTPLKLLTRKTAFLLAVTSTRRISDIQALSIKEPFFYCLRTGLFLDKIPCTFRR